MKIIPAGAARIPALGFGTWQLEGKECSDGVADALAAGYRHVDTAWRYGNHEAVGEGLARSRVPRGEVFLTTKIWFEDLRPADLCVRAEESLKQLRTDYVDLLLIHWPNPRIPLEDTLEAMEGLRDAGLTRHIGVSNFPPSWVVRAAAVATPVCDQVEYHALLSQDHLLGPLRKRAMALVAYSPLAHGRLLDHPVLAEIAADRGQTPAQVALRWLVQQEQVGAIPKASSREHMEQNLRIFEFSLEEEEMERIHALAEREGERVIEPGFAPTWER